MRVDRSVSSGTRQVLVLTVWNVEVSLRITVLLGQTEINNVDLVASLANAHQEVVRLDIAVDEGLGMDVLDAGDELVGKQENSLEGELAVAEVEQVFQAGAEQVEDHGIVVTFRTEPANEGNADTASKGFVDASFVFQLRVLGLDGFELDGNFFARDDVGAQVNISKTTTADLPTDTVLVTNTQILQIPLASRLSHLLGRWRVRSKPSSLQP